MWRFRCCKKILWLVVKMEEEKSLRLCEWCESAISEKKCPVCGRIVSSDYARKDYRHRSSIYCSVCGSQTRNARYCMYCGSPMQNV